MTNRPTPERLEEMYHGEKMTQSEIGDRFGVTKRAVSSWMDEFGIQTRSNSEAQNLNNGPPRMFTDPKGYECFHMSINGTTRTLLLHRLLAVAGYSFETVRDNHVHHINGIRWDNRPDNIEPMSPEEHAVEHHREITLTDELLMLELYENNDMTQDEVAEQIGTDQGTVSRRLAQ
jgi:DNA-binding XRE family transcriptional regulator